MTQERDVPDYGWALQSHRPRDSTPPPAHTVAHTVIHLAQRTAICPAVVVAASIILNFKEGLIGSLSCLCGNCSLCACVSVSVSVCVCVCVCVCVVHFFRCQASPAGAEWPGESTVKCCPCFVLLRLPLGCRTKTRCDFNIRVAPLSETIHTKWKQRLPFINVLSDYQSNKKRVK